MLPSTKFEDHICNDFSLIQKSMCDTRYLLIG